MSARVRVFRLAIRLLSPAGRDRISVTKICQAGFDSDLLSIMTALSRLGYYLVG
jgi:hypothetical protein